MSLNGSPEVTQICCLIEEGQRCQSPATNATFNKKLLKSVSQRRQPFFADPEVSQVPKLDAGKPSSLISTCDDAANRNTVWCSLNRIYLVYLFTSLQVSHSYVCERHRILLHSMRAKRKRKDSEEENDYQTEVIEFFVIFWASQKG